MRGISLKSLDAGDPKASGKEFRLASTIKEGISQDDAKKIAKIIRDEGPKGVQPQIQGDQLRVTSKKRDDLQEVIALLKGKELDVALQFTNYRLSMRLPADRAIRAVAKLGVESMLWGGASMMSRGDSPLPEPLPLVEPTAVLQDNSQLRDAVRLARSRRLPLHHDRP